MAPIRFTGKEGVLPTPSTQTLRIERRDESAGEALVSLRFTPLYERRLADRKSAGLRLSEREDRPQVIAGN